MSLLGTRTSIGWSPDRCLPKAEFENSVQPWIYSDRLGAGAGGRSQCRDPAAASDLPVAPPQCQSTASGWAGPRPINAGRHDRGIIIMIRVIRDSGSDSKSPWLRVPLGVRGPNARLSPGDSRPSQYSATLGRRLNLRGLQPALTAWAGLRVAKTLRLLRFRRPRPGPTAESGGSSFQVISRHWTTALRLDGCCPDSEPRPGDTGTVVCGQFNDWVDRHCNHRGHGVSHVLDLPGPSRPSPGSSLPQAGRARPAARAAWGPSTVTVRHHCWHCAVTGCDRATVQETRRWVPRHATVILRCHPEYAQCYCCIRTRNGHG